MTWLDLSDAELRERLLMRGVPADVADGWVRCRDDDEVARDLIQLVQEGQWP